MRLIYVAILLFVVFFLGVYAGHKTTLGRLEVRMAQVAADNTCVEPLPGTEKIFPGDPVPRDL
jgi:hypothetical protein